MIFDGSAILVGDNVTDVAYGGGQVVELKPNEGRFVVQFGPRMIGYTLAGVGHFGRKTLYWHDPTDQLPVPKSSQAIATFRAVKTALHNALIGNGVVGS